MSPTHQEQPGLFGDDPTSRARPTRSRRLVRSLRALRNHPAVAWCERQNSGAFRTETGQFVRFGWKGCADVIGQLQDGRFLAVEVKAPKGRLRPEQGAFLDQVRGAGGVAFLARNCADVARELATFIN